MEVKVSKRVLQARGFTAAILDVLEDEEAEYVARVLRDGESRQEPMAMLRWVGMATRDDQSALRGLWEYVLLRELREAARKKDGPNTLDVSEIAKLAKVAFTLRPQ